MGLNSSDSSLWPFSPIFWTLMPNLLTVKILKLDFVEKLSQRSTMVFVCSALQNHFPRISLKDEFPKIFFMLGLLSKFFSSYFNLGLANLIRIKSLKFQCSRFWNIEGFSFIPSYSVVCWSFSFPGVFYVILDWVTLYLALFRSLVISLFRNENNKNWKNFVWILNSQW